MLKKLAFWFVSTALVLWGSFTFAQWWFWNQATDYNPDTVGSKSKEDWGLLKAIQKIINYLLWLLALIALIMLLWWGFQMVTAAWDDGKYKKWFTILQQAGVWIAIIWFSWLIVWFIFSVVLKAWGWSWQ